MRLTKRKPPSATLAFLPITIHSVKCTLIDRNYQNLQLKSSVVMVSNPLWTCTNYHEPLRGVSLSKAVATSKPPRFLFCMDILATRLSHGNMIIIISRLVMAYLRYGAMRNYSERPMNSSYSVIESNRKTNIFMAASCGHI